MPFDWTSFLLEILNFLVLLWILTRFLYRPVLAVLDARQDSVRKQLAEAAAARQDAAALKIRCEAQLAAWSSEREQARRALQQELAQERAAALDALKRQLADEKSKTMAREQALIAAREPLLAQQAAARAYALAAAMLRRLASPELTLRIADVFAEDMHMLPEEQRAALCDAATAVGPSGAVDVATAHALDEECRQHITQILRETTGQPLQPTFREMPELIAGLRIAIGERMLQANLADELAFFKERDFHV